MADPRTQAESVRMPKRSHIAFLLAIRVYSLSFLKEGGLIKKEKFKKGRKERLQGKFLNSHGAITLGRSGKSLSLILRNNEGRLEACFFKGRKIAPMPKYQNPPFGPIGKCHEACQTMQSGSHPDFSRDKNIINTF